MQDNEMKTKNAYTYIVAISFDSFSFFKQILMLLWHTWNKKNN